MRGGSMTRDDIRKLLWDAANSLRIHVDAATYKHPVLGLIFLKYVSDRFELRRHVFQEDQPQHRVLVGGRIDVDAATYKHPVLGLIFLKYVSDRFELRRRNLAKWAQLEQVGH